MVILKGKAYRDSSTGHYVVAATEFPYFCTRAPLFVEAASKAVEALRMFLRQQIRTKREIRLEIDTKGCSHE